MLEFSVNHKEPPHLYCRALSNKPMQAATCHCCLSQTQAGIWCGHAVSSSKKQSVGYINDLVLVSCFQLKVKNNHTLRDVLHCALIAAQPPRHLLYMDPVNRNETTDNCSQC